MRSLTQAAPVDPHRITGSAGIAVSAAILLEVGGRIALGVRTAVASTARPTLNEGYRPLFGPVTFVFVALISATSAQVIFASKAFPRWAGRLAGVVAVLNVVVVPTVFGGTDNRSFSSVGGWGRSAGGEEQCSPPLRSSSG